MVADFQAQAIAAMGPASLCGQAMLHFEYISNSDPKEKDEWHLELGNKNFPIIISDCKKPWLPGCIGWFELHKKPSEFIIGGGIGKSYALFWQTPRFGFEACNLYGYVNAYIAFAGFATIQADPFKWKKLGVTFGAGVDIGVNFSGFFCPFGNLEAVHLYLGGDLVFLFPENMLQYDVSGEVRLLGLFSANFRFKGDAKDLVEKIIN